MQNLLVCAFLLACLGSHAQTDSLRQETDSLLIMLEELDTDDFINKPADSFLLRLPQDFKQKLMLSKNPKYAYMLCVNYNDRPYLEIFLYFYSLKHTNPQGISKKKQVKDLRKETVKAVEIYQSSVCVNGCEL